MRKSRCCDICGTIFIFIPSRDGCSEGACGTCTIIVDGRAVKSCVLTTKRAAGKTILTTEGAV